MKSNGLVLLGALVCLGLPCCRKEPAVAVAGGSTANAAPAPAPAAAPPVIQTPSGVEMVLVPAGTFVMGSAQGTDSSPAHPVTLQAFYMDRTEVTQKSYEELMGVNISKFEGDRNPVEQVRWTQAARYCNARSLNEDLKPCYDEATWVCDFEANGYRLPTEAEWEYACRAGTTGAYSFGDNAKALPANAWCKENANKSAHPVAQKPANPWGFFDLHGNVAEWCNDFYAPDYYGRSPGTNPRGPEPGAKRVIRGGHWSAVPEKCTSHFRLSDAPGLPDVCLGYDVYGFRCVRSAQESKEEKIAARNQSLPRSE